MEQKRTAPRAQKTQPLTYREWKRRKQLRLARNWGLFLAGCALVVFLLTKGILWLLPRRAPSWKRRPRSSTAAWPRQHRPTASP